MFAKLIDQINSRVFGPGLCVAVFACGIFLLFYLKGFFILKPRRVLASLKLCGGNGMAPMKAMTVALAGTLGVGNIAGVASALAIGGSGAVFWMLASSIAALPIKYAEVVLAMRHRRRDTHGALHGGAYFYIADHGTRMSSVFAAFFAILCLVSSLTMGTAVQANAIAVSAETALGLPPILIGVILAVLVVTVASGGLERIAFVTSRLIPAMSGVYILMSLFIIVTNLPMLPDIASDILASAFDAASVGGGVVGFITSRALRIGVTRGIVSNEAGCGTAPIAHASADSKSPAAQGVWGMVEVFIDTVVICTLTALSVLIAERHGIAPTIDGMASAVLAYARFIPFAALILAAAIFIFAFCTIVCWFYYGTESLAYLTKSKRGRGIYLIIYALCTLIGAVSSAEGVWSLCDLAISLMTAVNITALILSVREVKEETDRWFFAPKCKKEIKILQKFNNTVAKSRNLW